MIAPPRSPVHSSVFALALTAVALLISLVIHPYLEPNTFLLFIVAVWLSAWYHGRAGGALATAASSIAVLYFFLRPGATAADLSWSLAARLLGFVLMALLITWVTASWRESRRLLAATLSSIGDGVLVTDREQRVTFLNAVAETLSGWPAEEARGKPACRSPALHRPEDPRTDRRPAGHGPARPRHHRQ